MSIGGGRSSLELAVVGGGRQVRFVQRNSGAVKIDFAANAAQAGADHGVERHGIMRSAFTARGQSSAAVAADFLSAS